MNAIHSIHEDRKQAHADLVIADEMKALIENYCGIIRSALMEKCRDVSPGMIDHVEAHIQAHFGNGLSDAVTDITYQLRCRAVDLVGETVCRPRPIRQAAE